MSSFESDPALVPAEFRPDIVRGGEGDFRPVLEATRRVAERATRDEGTSAAGADADGVDVDDATGKPDGVAPEARKDRDGRFTAEQVEARETEAFERGRAEARDEIERLACVCVALESAVAEWRRSEAMTLAANRTLLLDLAVEIAGQWVGRVMASDLDALGAAIDRVLVPAAEDEEASTSSAEAGRRARLFLHPNDHETLVAEQPDRLARWAREGSLQVATDAELESGSFRLERADRVLDGRPSVVLERLRDRLAEALEADSPGGAS